MTKGDKQPRERNGFSITRAKIVFKHAQIVTLWKLGRMSHREIARNLKTSKGVVEHVVTRYRKQGEQGPLIPFRTVGNPRDTTTNEDEMLLQLAYTHPFASTGVLCTMWNEHCGLDMSRPSVYRRLKEMEVFKLPVSVRLPLGKAHVTDRLRFALYHRRMKTNWDDIVFADECAVFLSQSGRIHAWRRRDERVLVPIPTKEQLRKNRLFIWGCISSKGKGFLCVQRRPFNSRDYARVTEDYLLPSFHGFGSSAPFKFIEDNASIHHTEMAAEARRRAGIKRISFPRRSPDLNPIEHVWAQLKGLIYKDLKVFDDLQELERTIRSSWDKIPIQNVRNTIASMNKRIEAVIQAKGNNNVYN